MSVLNNIVCVWCACRSLNIEQENREKEKEKEHNDFSATQPPSDAEGGVLIIHAVVTLVFATCSLNSDIVRMVM